MLNVLHEDRNNALMRHDRLPSHGLLHRRSTERPMILDQKPDILKGKIQRYDSPDASQLPFPECWIDVNAGKTNRDTPSTSMVPFPTILLLKPPNFVPPNFTSSFMLLDSDRSSSANVQHDENLFEDSPMPNRANTHERWMRAYTCPMSDCAKMYDSKKKLDHHVLAIHKLQAYRCVWSHCENNHYRGVASADCMFYVCNACGKGFARETYRIHVKECGVPGNKGTAATCQRNGNDENALALQITCDENYFISGPKNRFILNWLEDVGV